MVIFDIKNIDMEKDSKKQVMIKEVLDILNTLLRLGISFVVLVKLFLNN